MRATSVALNWHGLLDRRGHDVTLFEKSSVPRTDGCGIMLSKPRMQALQQGNPAICRAIAAAGNPVRRYEFRNLKGSVAFAQNTETGSKELASNLVHCKAILDALLAEVPASRLRFGPSGQSIERTVAGDCAEHDGWPSLGRGPIGGSRSESFSRVRDTVVQERAARIPRGQSLARRRGRRSLLYGRTFQRLHTRSRHLTPNPPIPRTAAPAVAFFIEYEQTEAEKYTPRPFDCQLPANELAKLPEEARSLILSTSLDRIVARFC